MKRILAFLAALLLGLGAHAFDLAAFGGACDGVSDNTPALNAAIAEARASLTDKTINVPAGDCFFYSQPNSLSGAVGVIGQGKSTTVLRRAYSGSFFHITGNGVRIKDLTIYANAGTSGGIGIEMVASDLLGPGGNHNIASVWITGKGTWAVPLGAWGGERTIPPAGIRAVTLQDVSVFQATWQAVTLWGCVSCEWWGGGAYQGTGTTQAIVIGGPNAYKDFVSANIDWAASTIYPGVMR